MHHGRRRDRKWQGEEQGENTGIRIVPNPKPENKVSAEVNSAARPISVSSMMRALNYRVSLSNIDYISLALPQIKTRP